MQLLKKNKMLAIEILFEFPSREIKEQILSNYDDGRGRNQELQDQQDERLGERRPGSAAEAPPIDCDNFGEDGENNYQEDQQIEENEDEAKKEQEQTRESNEPQWTQEMDEILIS